MYTFSSILAQLCTPYFGHFRRCTCCTPFARIIRQAPLTGDHFEISLTTVRLKKKQPDVRFYAASVVSFTDTGAILRIHHRTRDITKSDRIVIEEGCVIETSNVYKANVVGVQHLGRPMNPYIEVESEDLLELYL